MFCDIFVCYESDIIKENTPHFQGQQKFSKNQHIQGNKYYNIYVPAVSKTSGAKDHLLKSLENQIHMDIYLKIEILHILIHKNVILYCNEHLFCAILFIMHNAL